MSEWWTYRLADFLMFSPRTYWRLVELYNRDLWPWQVVSLGAGLALLWLAATRGAAAGRPIATVLAVTWLWVAWAFHWQRYASINWGARYLAAAFVLQAVLLLLVAAVGRAAPDAHTRDTRRRIGLLLAACGVLAYPLTVVATGRPLAQSELFGLAPEPTALATVGLLLTAAPRWRGALLVIPLLSLGVGAATMWLLSN